MSNDEKVKCGLYTRVSSKGQMESEYGSLETQRERLEAYCNSREGFSVYNVYEDGGFSGSTTDRPALKRMLQDIRDGKINCVLAYKIDRIARSVKDFHNLIDYFDQYGVNFISITQSFDTQSAMGRLLRNVLCDFAQFEREMIADRTRDKMQQRAQKGFWNGGIPPYGYTKSAKKLIVDPVEAGRVKFMFERFRHRPSLAALRDELHQRDWLPRSGRRWGKTSIDTIIRNPVYTGKVQFNGEIYDGQQQALIDWETFEQVQNLRRDYSHVTTKLKRVFLLKGLLRCGDCGSIMTPHYTQKRRKDGSVNRIPYYRCSKTMHYNNRICSVKSINANEIEHLIADDLTELCQNERLLTKSIADLNSELQRRVEPMEKEAAEVRRSIAEIEEELQNYVKGLGKGVIAINRLEQELKIGESEKRMHQSRLDALVRQINDQAVSTFNIELVRQNLSSFQACFSALDSTERAEALQCILKEVLVERDQITLEIFELPEFAAGSQNRSIKYPRQDSNLLPSA